MEQHILSDLYAKFEQFGIPQPDLIVWLRPTFVFRNVLDVQRCIDILTEDPTYTSARTVCETESRIYRISDQELIPKFDDGGKSMIRRQDIGTHYKVYSTDVIRANNRYTGDDFLGNKVAAVVTNKLCGFDIDDQMDFDIVNSILTNNQSLINAYT
jgi:CMP-N,N'-diacetyllegionaminic acid synthase